MLRRSLFLLALLSSVMLLADVPSGSIGGTITDASGGVLTGSLIAVRNTETKVQRTTTTNQAGTYRLVGIQAGVYEISVSKTQFTTAVRGGLNVRVGDELRIDFTLQPGEARESIVVKEATPLTQLETATASTVVNERSIQDLPSDGRQLQNLALIVPGVSAGWNVSTAANRYGKARENTEGAFNVNGARSRSNNFLLDGMPMNVQQYSVINFEPSNEAVSQFAVLSELPAAEFGRTMGGQVNIVTRSGSSQFHGSAYEFFRNNVLNANTTFSNRAGLARGVVRHNQFGGSLGGPIWKQKHFFFVNTELLRNQEGSETRTSFVPTAAQSRGQISYVNAAGAAQTLDLAGRVAPLSAKLLELYPSPNAALTTGNYIATLAIALNDYQYHVRTDHHLTERDVVSLRTSWNLNDQVYIVDRFGGPYIPGFPLPNPERTTNGTLGYLHTFSAAVVNQARIGVNRYGNDLANGDPRNAAEFGLPNGSSANGIPTITFSAGGLADLGGLTWYNRIQNETTVFASDMVSVLRGAHALKFGGDFTRHHFNTRGAGNQRGTISFDGSRNTLIPKLPANGLANVLTDLLLGLPYQASITTGQFGRGYRQSTFAFFVQDSWRVNRRLTVEYGVRYDYSAPYAEVNGKLSNFVAGRGLVTASGSSDTLYQPDRNNFAPRLGFAYDLTGSNRTVLRGGVGLLYETHLQASTVQQIENNAPFSASASTNAPTPFPAGAGPAQTLLDLLKSVSPSRSLGAVPLDLRNPYSLQYSLDLQHALSDSWVAEAAYRATGGVHLPVNFNANQVPLALLSAAQRAQVAAAINTPQGTGAVIAGLRPFPDFNAITLYANVASSTYHSLQLKLERRFRSGLNLLLGYTWSKSIDDASDFGSGDPSERVLNSYNRRLQRAVSSFDIPSRFTAAFNYTLPAASVWRPVLSGWKLNGNITLQSGQPFTPYTSQFDPYTGESFNRLDVIGDPHSGVPAGRAYNPAAFALPALGTFGNSGRNIVRGDGFHTADLSLFRDIRLSERMKLQFRLEATNALNQVNYQGPVTNQSTNPGAFVATAIPRTVQLGLKFSF
ncbi:MAG: TonB-dependent receptor [Bryobacterales bacterium]|nr:TonB-dependent receptor [Bryobacterales bacterium]